MSLSSPVATEPGRPAQAARPEATGSAAAAGLAAAMLATNVIALVATLVFTRLLGSAGWGSLAALLNLSLILFVPGSALQIAVAREGALGRLGDRAAMAGALARWERHTLVAVAALAVLAVLGREPLAALLEIEETWAAAAVPVAAALFLLVCLQRGLLQAERCYRSVGWSMVGEATARLALGVLLVGAGLEVSGAYVAIIGSMLATAGVLAVVLRRRLGPPAARAQQHPLRALLAAAVVPIAALTGLAVLQNVDVIVAQHALDDELAGSYAAATVAAKALVWIAVGIGMWVLPEAVRRAAAGQDARRVLLRAFAIIGAIAAPALLAFAVAPGRVMRTAFGPEFQAGERVLLVLGVAYALLAVSYLTVQFLLGVGRRLFLAVLALAAVAEPALLATAGSLEAFAAFVLAVQAATTATLLLMALRRPETAPAPGLRAPAPPAPAPPG